MGQMYLDWRRLLYCSGFHWYGDRDLYSKDCQRLLIFLALVLPYLTSPNRRPEHAPVTRPL